MVGQNLNIDGLVARVQKIRHRASTSFPLISGDNFASLADFSFVANMNYKNLVAKISKSKVFFCESNLIHDFLNHSAHASNNSILIVGNGDQDYLDSDIFPQNFSKVLLQNSFISDNDRIFTLPIGIENLRIGVNGIPSRFESNNPRNQELRTLLIGPFGDTNSERSQLDGIDELPGINIIKPPNRVSPHKYPTLLKEATWVACPRGNGIDTHRVWEALYFGSKPIVLANAWSRSLVDFGYPLLLTSDWSNNSLHSSILKDPNPHFEPKQLPMLWMDYWENWLKERTS